MGSARSCSGGALASLIVSFTAAGGLGTRGLSASAAVATELEFAFAGTVRLPWQEGHLISCPLQSSSQQIGCWQRGQENVMSAIVFDIQ
jgi:hypothetical protein